MGKAVIRSGFAGNSEFMGHVLVNRLIADIPLAWNLGGFRTQPGAIRNILKCSGRTPILRRGNKLILAALVLVALMAVSIVWSVGHRVRRVEIALRSDATPVPPNASTLNGADVEKILGVEQFRTIRRVKEIPPVVMKSFSIFTQNPFDLANPDEGISHDEIIPGKSRRRLVFLAVSSDSAVLCYEKGGFVDTFNAVVFWFDSGGHAWGSTLERGPIPHDISTLKAAIQSGKFR